MGKAQPKQSAIAAFGLQLLGGPELSAEFPASKRRPALNEDLDAPGQNGASEVAEQQEAAEVVSTQPAEQQMDVTGILLQPQGAAAEAPSSSEAALAKARAEVADARLAELDAQRLLDSASPQLQQVAAALPAEHVPGVLHEHRTQSSPEQLVQPLPLSPVDGRVTASPRSASQCDAAAGARPASAVTVEAPANMRSHLPKRTSERPATTQHVHPEEARQEGAVSSAAAQSTRSAASSLRGSAANAASVLNGRGATAFPGALARGAVPPAAIAISDGQGCGGRSSRAQQHRRAPDSAAAAANPAPPTASVRPLDTAQSTAQASAGGAPPAVIDTGTQRAAIDVYKDCRIASYSANSIWNVHSMH